MIYLPRDDPIKGRPRDSGRTWRKTRALIGKGYSQNVEVERYNQEKVGKRKDFRTFPRVRKNNRRKRLPLKM